MASQDEMIEYQEGNKIAMAYATFTLMAGSIFISASFAIFGLSFSIQKPTYGELFLMFQASVILYLVFLVYNKRYTRYTHGIIFPLLQKFEKEKNMKMKIHTKIQMADDHWKKVCHLNYTALRIHTWNLLGFVALCILWIFRIIFKN